MCFLPEGRDEVERLQYDEDRVPDIYPEVDETGTYVVESGTGGTAITFSADEGSAAQLEQMAIDRFAVDEGITTFRLVELNEWFDLMAQDPSEQEGQRFSDDWFFNFESSECDA